MDKLVLVLMLAVTVEALVEYTKNIIKAFTDKCYKCAIVQLCAMVISIVLCVLGNADMYAALGVPFIVPGIGMVLTGIFASRGANFVSDLIGRLRGQESSEQPAEPSAKQSDT